VAVLAQSASPARKDLAKQKVLHVSTSHWPYDTRIFRKELISLAQNGYAVSFATTVDEAQVVRDIRFIPVGEYGGSRWRRIERNFRSMAAIWTHSPDIIHIHDPELLITIIPALLAGKRIIYDIHEFWQQRLSESDWIWSGVRVAAAKFYSALERALIPHCAGVIVVTERMEEMYRHRFPRTNISLVRNYPWIDDESRTLALSQAPPLEGHYIVQIGGATHLKAFDIIVATAEVLREHGVTAPIINLGPVDLSAFPAFQRQQLLDRAKLADVRLPGIVDYPELLRWVAHARIGYVLRTDVENSRLGLPTKLFEYFALGVPVVATSVGRMGEIVRQHNAGLVVPANDPHAHAAALKSLLVDDGLAQRTAQAAREASKNFTFQTEQVSLLNLYRRITSQPLCA